MAYMQLQTYFELFELGEGFFSDLFELCDIEEVGCLVCLITFDSLITMSFNCLRHLVYVRATLNASLRVSTCRSSRFMLPTLVRQMCYDWFDVRETMSHGFLRNEEIVSHGLSNVCTSLVASLRVSTCRSCRFW